MASKSKVIKKTIGPTSELNDMFNQMIGSDTSANINIIYGKYKLLEESVDKLLKMIDIIYNLPLFDIEVLHATKVEMIKYYAKQKTLWDSTKLHYFDNVLDISLADLAHKAELIEIWPKMKGSALVQDMVKTYDELAPYRSSIEHADKSTAFINNMPGSSWCPISALKKFDIKYICAIVDESTVQRTIISVLAKMLSIGQDIYKIKMNPDFDITQCSDLIIKSIVKLKTNPELSRCGKAFAKIEKSMHLLEGNFDQYHRDYLSTGNSHIILENFCQDAAKQTDIDVETTMQFKNIINFYRKQSDLSKSQPKLAKIIDSALPSFDLLDEYFSNKK